MWVIVKMRPSQNVIEAEISEVLFDLGHQIYSLTFDGSESARTNFASFAWLDFGKFENEKKYFRNAVSNSGKKLVVIHKCPTLKNERYDAFSVRVPRKDILVSCSACHYRFDKAISLPDSVFEREMTSTGANEKDTMSDRVNLSTENPIEILKVILAKGEITSQEYTNLRKIIET